jgi:hypothetical protein
MIALLDSAMLSDTVSVAHGYPKIPAARITVLFQSTRVRNMAVTCHHTDVIVSINPSHPALRSSEV